MIIGMRDLVRNSNILDGHDYVDVEDKKTHEYKGLFVSPKYIDDVKNFIEEKIKQEKQEKLDKIMRFSGSIEIDSKYLDMSSNELRKSRAIKR